MWGAVKTHGTSDPSGSDEMETREMIFRIHDLQGESSSETGSSQDRDTVGAGWGVSHPSHAHNGWRGQGGFAVRVW